MHSWVMPMEEFIHQQNLGRYRKMLSEKTHEPQRQTILRLLADEETRDDVPGPLLIIFFNARTLGHATPQTPCVVWQPRLTSNQAGLF